MRRGRRNAKFNTPLSEASCGAKTLTSSRIVVVVGAGIGGLTTALALERNGFRVVVLEQAERLEETGAGIQLSPNAARTLINLGLAERLQPHVVSAAGLRVLDAGSGREIVRMPLGEAAARRYGAPYWTIHRGDLQAALAGAVAQKLDITVKLGMHMDDFVVHRNGVTVSAHGGAGIADERGIALIAADGLRSVTRARLGYGEPPRFAGRTAWRALVPAKDVSREFAAPLIQLWLGRDAHLVHYPVKGGSFINVVVIMEDSWNEPGWSEPAARTDLLPRFSTRHWSPLALSLLSAPEAWLKWALYDRRPILRWSQGPVALLGDAAHPMLPYLAQGAAMAIEDAAVAAQCLARAPDNPTAALQTYSAARRARAWKVQRLAARNGSRYHLKGLAAMLRDAAMRALGGERLLHHYDWIYDWRPPAALSLT
jgi:2-polyprenyl-6-methoxyphenol hydroxylase-like FAD-dependent oxidoreductase